MPIVDQTVIDGPRIQDSGIRSGAIKFVFDDGREIIQTVRAEDAAAWAELLIDLPGEVQAAVEAEDAVKASESDGEVADAEAGQASQAAVALAYLRKAYSLDDPYKAFLKFDKFNNYRVAKGWNLNQVVAGLSSVGLTEEEWDLLRDAYSYLSQAARVTTMEAYQPIHRKLEAKRKNKLTDYFVDSVSGSNANAGTSAGAPKKYFFTDDGNNSLVSAVTLRRLTLSTSNLGILKFRMCDKNSRLMV